MGISEKIKSAKEILIEKERKVAKEIEEIDSTISELKKDRRLKIFEIKSIKREERVLKDGKSSAPLTLSIISQLENEKEAKKLGGVSQNMIMEFYEKIGIKVAKITLRNQISNLAFDNAIFQSNKLGNLRIFKTIQASNS